MRFSLRTFLLATCVVGAGCGIMGKWLLDDPEMFLAALTFGATVVPFVLATGTLIVLGRRKRQWKLEAWGAFLFFLPVVLLIAHFTFLPSGNPIRLLTTRRLIERRLPDQIEQPWPWQELKRRLDNGRLSSADATDAVDALIDHMKSVRPAGWDQPLAWQHDFILAVVTAKMISKEKLLELCDAFYGTQPKVEPIARLTAGHPVFHVVVRFGSPWTGNSGLQTELLWDVKQVLLDGQPVKVSQGHRFAQQWSGFCDTTLAPGEHELAFDMECAYVDELAMRNQGWEIPIARWPIAKKRWSTRVTAPVKVQAAGK